MTAAHDPKTQAAQALVSVAPSPAASGLSLQVDHASDFLFSTFAALTPPFKIAFWPYDEPLPTISNCEVALCSGITPNTTRVGGVTVTELTAGAVGPGIASIVETTPGDSGVPQSAVQTLTITADGGTYPLTFGANTTTLNWNDNAATIQAALRLLASIGGANVTVAGTGPYTITFIGTLANAAQPLITTNSSSLTNGGTNEVVVISIDADAGTFTVTVGANTTAAQAWNVTAANLQTAITGLASVGAGNCAVTNDGTTYTLTFQSGKANQPITVTANGASLTKTTDTLTLQPRGGIDGTTARSVVVGDRVACAVLPDRDFVTYDVSANPSTYAPGPLAARALIKLTAPTAAVSVLTCSTLAGATTGREYTLWNYTGLPIKFTTGGNLLFDDFIPMILPYGESMTFTCDNGLDFKPITGVSGNISGPVLYRDIGLDRTYTAAIPPSTINNYALPPGVHTVRICCVDGGGAAANVTLTGIAPDYDPTAQGSEKECRELLIVNDDYGGTYGGGVLTLSHLGAGSLAWNRFRNLTAANLALPGGARALIRYDNDDTYWHVVAVEYGATGPTGAAGGDLTGTYPNPTIKASVGLTVNPTAPTQSPSDNSTRIASTAYVTTGISNAIAGVNPAVAVAAATTAAADTSGYTYLNGAAGVGATLTGAVNTALTVDGYTFTALGQRLLVKNDTVAPSGARNGVYYVTQVQTAILPLILTRALDYNTPSDINNTGAIPVVNGTLNALTSWLLTSQVTTVGTDPLTYTQFTINPTTELTNVLASANLFVGSAGGVATARALTGDVSVTNTGVSSIVNGAVTPAKLSSRSFSFLMG